ncbi:MAG: lactonase family protein [Flavobacteriaceae bacterium]
MNRLLAFIFSIVIFNTYAQDTPLYVGTYTNGDSQGIYKFDFNTETGELNNLQLVAAISNPSFIAFSPNKKHIYAVNENENGTVSAFSIQPDGSLALINQVESFGGAPCHVSVNGASNKVAVSNYLGGNFALFNINPDGSLSDATQVVNHFTRTETAHVHSAQFIGNDLFVADLGKNALYHYNTQNNDEYFKISNSVVPFTENAGPRHFATTKGNRFIYVVNELAGTVTAIKKKGDSFFLIDNYTTLDENYNGKNACADIHLSNDEGFVYASNRGENSIAVFKRNTKKGTLKKIQNVSVEGDWPRNFTLDPTGRFLLVANQKSNTISIFNIDTKKGTLLYLQSYNAPTPVCLVF